MCLRQKQRTQAHLCESSVPFVETGTRICCNGANITKLEDATNYLIYYTDNDCHFWGD